jgi:hypothetical protein
MLLPPPGHTRFPSLRNLINTVTDLRGMDEVTAQMKDVFQKGHLVSERNMIEQHEMLMDLPHVPDVRRLSVAQRVAL